MDPVAQQRHALSREAYVNIVKYLAMTNKNNKAGGRGGSASHEARDFRHAGTARFAASTLCCAVCVCHV